MKITRSIEFFEKHGEYLVGEALFHSIVPLHQLQSAFGEPASDPMVHCWAINHEHVEFLSQYTAHEFNLNKYDYYLTCAGEPMGTPVFARKGSVVFLDRATGQETPVEYELGG